MEQTINKELKLGQLCVSQPKSIKERKFMLNKKTIRDISVSSKKVLVRCDFNVPLDKDNPDIITSDKRIVESLKTINN